MTTLALAGWVLRCARDPGGWRGFLWVAGVFVLGTAPPLSAVWLGGVTHIVIGTGWSEQVRVPPELRECPDVEPLATPAAIERYRQLRAEGVAVALLLHSTC